jgi:hypothetical protein
MFFFTKNNMSVVAHRSHSHDLDPWHFSPFPPLKIKLNCHHFFTQLRRSRQNLRRCWTPSQNKTTSRMHLKHGRRAGNGAYAQKSSTASVMIASRPKVSFWPDGSTSPGNYGYHFAHPIGQNSSYLPLREHRLPSWYSVLSRHTSQASNCPEGTWKSTKKSG